MSLWFLNHQQQDHEGFHQPPWTPWAFAPLSGPVGPHLWPRRHPKSGRHASPGPRTSRSGLWVTSWWFSGMLYDILMIFLLIIDWKGFEILKNIMLIYQWLAWWLEWKASYLWVISPRDSLVPHPGIPGSVVSPSAVTVWICTAWITPAERWQKSVTYMSSTGAMRELNTFFAIKLSQNDSRIWNRSRGLNMFDWLMSCTWTQPRGGFSWVSARESEVPRCRSQRISPGSFSESSWTNAAVNHRLQWIVGRYGNGIAIRKGQQPKLNHKDPLR